MRACHWRARAVLVIRSHEDEASRVAASLLLLLRFFLFPRLGGQATAQILLLRLIDAPDFLPLYQRLEIEAI